MSEKKCSITGCGKKIFCRDWCSAHYTKWQRYKDPLFVRDLEKNKLCKYPQCTRSRKSKGLCNTHATKFRRTGTLEWLRGGEEWKKRQAEAQRHSLSKIDPFRTGSERGYHAVNVVNDIKYKARQRGKEWNLTHEEAYNFIISECAYCGFKPNWPHERNGIDRTDNAKHYSIDNCVSCCFSCNSSKGTRSLNEFRDWIVKVYKNLIERK